MVLQREGRGKVSSPHLVKLLGTKILPKWGVMIHIGSLYNFSSISIKNQRNHLAYPFQRSVPIWKIGYKKLSKIFQSHFEASNDIFFGPNLLWRKMPYCTHQYLSNCARVSSISVTSPKLPLRRYQQKHTTKNFLLIVLVAYQLLIIHI